MPPEDDDPLAKPVPEPPHPILNAPVPPPPSAILSAPVPEPPSTNLIPIPSPKVTRFSVAKDMEPSPLDRQLSKAPDVLGTGVGAKPPGLSWGEVLDAAASGGVMAPEYRREPSIWNPIEDYNRIVPETPVAKLVGGAMDTMGVASRPIATIANQILPDKAPPFTPFWRPEWPPDWKHLLVGKLPETNIGDTLTAAAKSIPPEWAGRDTSKDVDTSKVISKVLPDPVDIYGDLSGNKSGAIVDPQTGEVSVGAGLAHLARGVRDFYVMKHVDPVMQLHPGTSEAGKIDIGGRSQALINAGERMAPLDVADAFKKQTGQLPPAEILNLGEMDQAGRENFANPNTSDLVNRGQLGFNFEGYGPVPKGFLPIPKAVAPVFKGLQPLFDWIDKGYSQIRGENQRSANQVTQKYNENMSRAAANQIGREELGPLVQHMVKSGIVERGQQNLMGDLTELFPEEGGPRLPSETPNGFAPSDAARLKGVAESRPDVMDNIQKAWADSHANGPLSEHGMAAAEKMTTLPADQQAALWQGAQMFRDARVNVRAKLANQGPRSVILPRMNADILDLPGKIHDAIDAIEKVEATKPFTPNETPTGKLNDFAEQAKVENIDTPALTKMIEDLRTAKAAQKPAVKAGQFPESNPGPRRAFGDNSVPEGPSGAPTSEMVTETPETPLNPADALTKRRLDAQAKATQKATGTPEEFSRFNELSRGELAQLKSDLYERLPLAYARKNSVPGWRPSELSELTKSEMTAAKDANGKPVNLNLRRPGVGLDVETAERGALAADDPRFKDYGNVKKSVWQTEQDALKGTPTNEGRSVADVQPTLADKFLSAIGAKELKRQAGESYKQLDPVAALQHKIDYQYYKAMTNAGIDAHVANQMNYPQMDTIGAIRKAWYDGIETGEKYDKAKPTYWHSQKGALIADATGKSGPTVRVDPSTRDPFYGGSRQSIESPVTPPWEYRAPENPLGGTGNKPFTEFAYPGMARFKEMAWADLTKLADEGNPAARQEVAMRMEPLSQGQSKTQGLQRIDPNTRDPFYTGSRQSVESPVTPANPLTPEQNPLGGLGDEPFQPRTQPFATDTGVDFGPWRSGMPNFSPADWFARAKTEAAERLARRASANEPQSVKNAPMSIDSNTVDPFYTGARQTVETPTTPPKPAVRQAQRTGGVDPFTPDATQWASYESMDWKDLGERARNGDPAARQEMARRVEPRSVKNAPMSIDANTRDPFYTGSRQTVETPTTPPRPETPRPEPSGPLPSNPMFSEGPRTQPQSIGPNEPKYAPLTEEVKMTRPPTLDDMEAIWKAGGEKGKFYDHLNQMAKDRLKAGEDFYKVIGKDWQPENMAYAELDGKSGYIHAGVAEELNVYKRLGQDAEGIARHMKANWPIYSALIQNYKKAATIYNPSFPAYMLMKQVHDQVRVSVKGIGDSRYPGEVLAGQKGHMDYVTDGRTDTLPQYVTEGGARIGGEAAARELEANGMLDRQSTAGTEAGEYSTRGRGKIFGPSDADARFTKGDQGYVGSRIDRAGEIGQNLQDIIRAQDNANRAASYYALRRAGKTPFEAAFQTQEALFDFTRKGPLTQNLSQTLIPFAGWHAKVIPFMIDWMVKNPGEFMLVQKALQQANAGMIPPSQLPQMIRDGTNIPLSTDRDATGKQFVTTMNVNGMVPGTEAINFMNDVMKHGGVNWLQQHLNPIARGLLVAGKEAARDEEDPARSTGVDQLSKIGKALIGRPGTVGSTLTDDTKTPGQQANMMLNPMRVDRWEESGGKHSQDQISIYSARRGVRSAEYNAADAQKAIQDEITKFVAAHKELAQAEAVKLSESDPLVIDARRKDAEARARVQRETEYFTKKALPELQDTKRKLQLFSPSFVP